ncbi:MAG: GAF domain-containing protein, partial [Phreatobacter sp.]
MALLPEDMSVDLKAAIDELESAISEMESRLEATRLERDGAKGRQVELEIENANLRRELGRARERTGADAAREQQAATANILRVIARAPSDLQPVFETIAESARRLCDGHTSLVTQVVGDAIHLAAASSETEAGTGEMLASFPTPLASNGIHSRVASSGELAFRHDMENEPDLTPEMKETARARGYRSILVVPMLREGVAIGTIGVTRREAGAFPENLIELLRTFADEAVIAIENARLIRETREALERQTATADILKVIASSPSDVQPVFDAIAASAKRLLGGFSAAVFRYVDGMVRLAAFTPTHPAADQALQADFPTPVDDFAAFRLAAHGQPFPIPDTEQVSHAPVKEIARLHGFRSMLWVPMVNAGVTIGVLSVTRAEPGAFAPHHTQLLQTFADQAVIAIENTRLFNEVQARTEELSLSLQQQTATADVLKVISRSAFDLKKVLDTLIESAVTLGGSRRGGIFFCDDDVLRLQSYFGFPDEQVAFLRANPLKIGMETMAGRAALLGRTVHIPDILEDRDFRNFSGQAVGKFRAFLGVPLKRDGKVFGVLAMNRPEPGPFSERQIDLVQTFADQAVIAIENVRLFDEVQARTEELSESLQQQTATADVLKVISRSAFDLQPVLDTLTESAAQLSNADMGAIALKDDRGYYHATNYNFPIDWVRVVDVYRLQPGRESIIGRALLARGPVQIADALTDPEYGYPDMQRVAGYRSLLGVPMVRGGEPIGVLFLGRKIVEPYSERQVELVSTFADQAVIAIENVRLFNEVQARTEELSESLQQQTAVGDVLKVISRTTFDLQPVLDTLVNTAAILCGADMAFIMRRAGDQYRAGAAVGYS